MSTYKIIDSTISILYCARCANEHLELVSPGRLVCPDCGTVTTFDTSNLRVGQLKGTKYKMRDSRRYSFREIIDEGREQAFQEVFVPSPEPGRHRTGWAGEAAAGEVRMAGTGDDRGRGWRGREVLEILTDENEQEENQNDQHGPLCSH